MEEEVSGAEDSLLGAVTVAVTGAVDEVTPLTRTKEMFLQTRNLPSAIEWVVSLVSTLKRNLSFLAIKTEFSSFHFLLFIKLLFFFLFLESLGGFFSPGSF